jgi:hypothetical protein
MLYHVHREGCLKDPLPQFYSISHRPIMIQFLAYFQVLYNLASPFFSSIELT